MHAGLCVEPPAVLGAHDRSAAEQPVGQIGALVQGLGGVFLDQVLYDGDAQILNTSLADYLVPLACDFPNVRAITMELRRSKTNPLGAKGAGEGGRVAVAAPWLPMQRVNLVPLVMPPPHARFEFLTVIAPCSSPDIAIGIFHVEPGG